MKKLRSIQFAPQSLTIFAFKKEFIWSVIAMSGGNGSYIDKAELKKTLHIECVKHNRQLKMNFLVGKHNMK